jgi:hypothetical protein
MLSRSAVGGIKVEVVVNSCYSWRRLVVEEEPEGGAAAHDLGREGAGEG